LTLPDIAARSRETAVVFTIRDATDADAGAIAAIYGHHVLHGTASYEVDPPSVEATVAMIRRVTSPGWPFIVVEVAKGNGREVAGYAYVTQFRDRAAYRFTCEDSIYVHPEHMGRGIGKALLSALIERSAAYGFRTIVAVIGGAEPASIALHASFGFAEAGRLKAVGFKFERWLDSVYMQLELQDQERVSRGPSLQSIPKKPM
jgi:L-amino acid N-acyltransferase YncA